MRQLQHGVAQHADLALQFFDIGAFEMGGPAHGRAQDLDLFDQAGVGHGRPGRVRR